jgi:hypothetical protein
MANIFEMAMNAYNEIINDLSSATMAFKRYADSNNIDYNPKITLIQFDILLQYSMLQVALGDRYLDKREISFIENITKYSDFCDYLRHHGVEDVSWNTLYNANEDDLNECLNIIKKEIIDLSRDFISIFSIYDATTDYNYLTDLKKNVLTIIIAVCQADGRAEKEEFENGCLILSVVNQIEKEKESIETKYINKPEQPKKSLKDFYVKKN